MINQRQQQFYRDNGYLFVADVFDATEVQALRDCAYRNVQLSRNVPSSDAKFDIGPGHSAEHPRLRRLKNPHIHEAVFDAAMRNPKLIDIVQPLLGTDVRFDHSKLNFKPAGAAETIEWHQDWAFYPHTNDDILAVGILLEDATSENGPLMVIPGSHRGPVYDHHRNGGFVGAINMSSAGFSSADGVEIIGRAGGVTVHHVRTVHGSRHNQTRNDRPLLIFSYAAVDAWPIATPVEDVAEFDSRILRGQPTRTPRQVGLPIRMPVPRFNSRSDSIYDDQDSVRGGSFEERLS